MNKMYWVIPAFLCLSATAFFSGYLLERKAHLNEAVSEVFMAVNHSSEPVYKYGLNMSEFVVIEQKVERNELFADILSKHNVAASGMKLLLQNSRNIFNPAKLRAGNSYKVLGENTDTGFVPKKIVYEESKLDYVVFSFDDSLYINRGQLAVERKHQQVAGIIKGSLYETFDEMGVPPALAVKLSEIFSCTVDFYKIKEGDRFKIVYDQDFAEGKPVGTGGIRAAIFTTGGKDYAAYYFEKDAAHEGEYYDEKGGSMHKQFLKAPVKFARISSRYNLHRFHPVDKVWRAHLGTDYAADYGTPIISTADGVVEEAKFGVYNGNYVKVRHNGQYKTQYLHMCKIAKGVRAGRHVRQGEVLGYVGSTGLATGPHVCYRFWKDGQQVDPLKQKLKFSEILPKKHLADFLNKTAAIRANIEGLAYGTRPVLPEEERLKALQSAYNPEAFANRWF
ncbi:MAG: peptidoglycan DD-metalloendopeptidase family protein [Chitinophagales bacterium]